MVQWLNRGDDDLEPSDKDIWGVVKPNYTFADLSTWKVEGTLNIDRKHTKASSKAIAKTRDTERKHKKDKNQSEDSSENKGKGKRHK